MNKQQEKQYKQYIEDFVACPDEQEPLTKEEFVEELEKQEAEEHEAYLNYQKKISENNAKLPEDKEPAKILTKEEWIKAGKPSGETKAERFIRLAEARTTKAISAIDKLEALVTPNYESSPEQRKQITDALRAKLAKLEICYAGKKIEVAVFKLQMTLG